jgi:hypothetical protein
VIRAALAALWSGVFIVALSGSTLAAGESLSGRYRLAADGRLILHELDLEFFQDAEGAANPDDQDLPVAKSGVWSARVIALPDPETPAGCRLCPPPFRERPLLNLKILQGLRERDDGEFLYGRLVLPGQANRLRCKVWPRGRHLFLRIYEKHHYTTHRLTRLP